MKRIKRNFNEPEYRQLKCISYSQLSNLDSYPESLIQTKPMEMTEPLIYGSAVDCLAFDGREVFDKKFTVISQEKPSWMLEKVLKGVIDEIFITHNELLGIPISEDLSKYSDIILKVAKSVEYGKGWKPETIIRKTIEGCGELYKNTIKNRDKLALSPQQYEYVENSVTTLFTHEFTAEFFTADEGQDIYYQLPIIWDYFDKELNKTIHCKSLLDILLIDHNTKTIYPIDLKTTGKSIYSFNKSFIEWRYFLQASFYSDAVKHLCNVQYPELADYNIALFKFVVISSKNPRKPLAFQITNGVLDAGKFGTVNPNNHKIKQRGYLELVRDMQWHINNQKFDYPKEIYDKKGMVILDSLF